ncbi:Hypothetical predicted protein [Octopus vulgaris]|uniref:Uncharacterized protein n=1 Tax=Octopus vulgaris TaxID=6645 RepID=A0AA36FDQ3_OCTVU|nr:Hypothetical predicted protein [Octopus vulgaris]
MHRFSAFLLLLNRFSPRGSNSNIKLFHILPDIKSICAYRKLMMSNTHSHIHKTGIAFTYDYDMKNCGYYV